MIFLKSTIDLKFLNDSKALQVVIQIFNRSEILWKIHFGSNHMSSTGGTSIAASYSERRGSIAECSDFGLEAPKRVPMVPFKNKNFLNAYQNIALKMK